ncbi:terminal uridylyltransferase Tailor-like [Aphis craccivora]|uniref:Terminal uridylyltransferase Tailor-like n=1 Tax=Aphis craccivora TaxID=307492 RepID=A0A6G0ZIG4_APHCR|nr:terminal uridylyltransferase Tailor-like [Aphis craccivora]
MLCFCCVRSRRTRTWSLAKRDKLRGFASILSSEFSCMYCMKYEVWCNGRVLNMTIKPITEGDLSSRNYTPGTFCGQLSNDLHTQTNLIRYFAKLFESQQHEYSQIKTKTTARVPIITFFHVPSGLYCDLSFKSGFSVYCTKLIKLYLSLDERVNWIVCAVIKHWALQSCMKSKSMFKSYSLAWLVLFYLIVIDVIPPLMFLRSHADYSKSLTSDVILGLHFLYSRKSQTDIENLKKNVLCPIIGQIIPKSDLYNIPIPMKKKNSEPPSETLRKLKKSFYGDGLALQDPLDLLNNITKRIRLRKHEEQMLKLVFSNCINKLRLNLGFFSFIPLTEKPFTSQYLLTYCTMHEINPNYKLKY